MDEALLKATVIQALSLSEAEYRADLKIGDVETWDSLGHLGLISAIEAAFDVQIPMDVIPELNTLESLRQGLERGTFD
jgi:acyl carrier protein